MIEKQPVRLLLQAVILMALLGPATSLGAPPGAPRDVEVRVKYPENYCLGGIEDRKIIVDESQLNNPFRETTRLGCQVDGGAPHTMPDLPTPSADQHRLV